MDNELADKFRQRHGILLSEYLSEKRFTPAGNMLFGEMLGLEGALVLLGEYLLDDELAKLRRKECA